MAREPTSEQKAPIEDSQDRTETGQTLPSRLPKTHQDYWKPRLKQRAYIDRGGRRVVVPEWQVRMFHLNREAWFNLDTANRAAAAVKARDIYLSLVASGWTQTLAKYKPDSKTSAQACTLGEFIADIQKRSHLTPMTVRRYVVKLRKMVSDIAKLEAGLKAKERRKKYDYSKGGRAAWLQKVDSQRISILTSDSIAAWRNGYVARAGADKLARKSAERSAASYLRCVRSLFSPDVLGVLMVNVPDNPFVGVKLRDPGPQRYHSEVNPEWLLACAEGELRAKKPQEYLALFLCLWAGLRRKEADLLMWEQVDLESGEINVRRTAWFEPKTEESERTIDIGQTAVDVLRAFKEGCASEFVLAGADPNPKATYDYYRCDCTWRNLASWLRGKGVTDQKAIHMLRKESGSLIASSHGIEAARQHLGHRDIRTTSAHYVGKKKRVEVVLQTASNPRALEAQ